ncbi:MAG: UxaA family hydrolase [Lachnospiraceae bacterium]
MGKQQKVFCIEKVDNVATALVPIIKGNVSVLGDAFVSDIEAVQEIPVGHKIALFDIKSGEKIIKYGVVIGKATTNIRKGTWVHLHCMCSLYDERSSHLDAVTGAPKDIKYE